MSRAWSGLSKRPGTRLVETDIVLTSDVPEGAGLSSSAALECAVLTALVDLNDLDIAGLERAKLARRAENAFVGAPTGLMDQAAATLCTVRHALFFDCRTDDAEQVRFDAASGGLEILVLDTKTPHALVDSEYAARRASCEEAARLLGVPALRDVTDLDAALDKLPDPVIQRRVRHVITENARVLEAVKVLRTGRIADLAPLLDASHSSMRDDFEITVPQVDLAVQTARTSGALGARMTGGGFGGCIIALVPAGEAERIGQRDRPAASQPPDMVRRCTSRPFHPPAPSGSYEPHFIVAIGFQTDRHRSNPGIAWRITLCQDPPAANLAVNMRNQPRLTRTWVGREQHIMNVRIKLGVAAASVAALALSACGSSSLSGEPEARRVPRRSRSARTWTLPASYPRASRARA